MFKKLFTINYNNKKFLILVDDNHRKTFLEVKDGSLTYPTLEDFKYLHKVYNEKDPLITYVTKYKYVEKIVHNDKLMDLKVAISTGLLAMSLFALTTPNSMVTFEPTPTVASTMPADPYGWRYDMNYEESLQYLERVNHNQTVTKNDVILAINNNKNFGEREKTIAINLLSSMLELDPGMNLRAYYESMKDYTIEYVSSEELQEETNLYIDGYCNASRKLIKVAQNAEDFVIAHELAHAAHILSIEVSGKWVNLYEGSGAFLAEAITDRMASQLYGDKCGYFIEGLVLDFFLYNTDEFNYHTYNSSGIIALINELKEKYPDVDIDYIIDFFQCNTDTAGSLGVGTKISENKEVLDELFKITMANISKDNPYESFKKFEDIITGCKGNGCETTEEYLESSNKMDEYLAEYLNEYCDLLLRNGYITESSAFIAKNMRYVSIIDGNIYISNGTTYFDYEGNKKETDRISSKIYMREAIVEAALQNKQVYSKDSIDELLTSYMLYDENGSNIIKDATGQNQKLMLNRIFNNIINGSNSYSELKEAYDDFNTLIWNADLYKEYWQEFYNRFKDEATRKYVLSEDELSQLALEETYSRLENVTGIIEKDGIYYLSTNEVNNDTAALIHGKYNENCRKMILVSPNVTNIECVTEDGFITLDIDRGISNYYLLNDDTREKLIEYFCNHNGKNILTQENIREFAQSIGINGEITYDNAFTLSDGSKIYDGELSENILLQLGKDELGECAYNLTDGDKVLYSKGNIVGNSVAIPYSMYLKGTRAAPNSCIDELLSSEFIGDTLSGLDSILPEISVNREYIKVEKEDTNGQKIELYNHKINIAFNDPLIVVIDGEEIPARLIQIIEADFGNIYAYFTDGSRMLINDYIKGPVMAYEPYYAYFDECLVNSDIEADSDGKYHLTKDEVAQIVANHINETTLPDMQK